MFQINWKLKSFLYNLFEFFKLEKLFYLIQKYITKRSKIDIKKINPIWKFHANSIKLNNCINILEIGAGKSLEQNIYLSYIFDEIDQTAIDINNMIDFQLFNNASRQISTLLGLENKGNVKNISDLEKKYKIKYRAPCNLEYLIKDNIKFDICISSTALEHFPVSDLNLFLKQSKSLLIEGGLISSVIDYSDHYSHTDKTLSPLNFLGYSLDEWVKFNNKYLFQNRLRHYEYKEIFKNNGYLIQIEKTGETINAPNNLSKEFDIKDERNFILWGYYLIKKN
jgi:SAM-dependent methyltransferase|tara:strand:- start:6193 stop:7035 length:843 start_codon:yes stop_codon:yes gene_type:complete